MKEPCVPCDAGAETVEDIIKALIRRINEDEVRLGKPIDWLSELPADKARVSAREVVDAMGRALTKVGIPNNLEQPSEA